MRFIAAYNALLTSATIALRATGYRVGSQPGHHVLTLETLQYTLGANGSLIRKLKTFATKRGKATYDVAGSVSADRLRGVLRAALELERMVLDWLRQHHPQLLAG